MNRDRAEKIMRIIDLRNDGCGGLYWLLSYFGY